MIDGEIYAKYEEILREIVWGSAPAGLSAIQTYR